MDKHHGQAEKPDFFKQLDVCCQKVAKKVGKETIADWKNSDYIRLSGLLYRQTKITISENTLKRIFGKLKTSTRYYPQKATRDALAQFIGYRDWHEFELLCAPVTQVPSIDHTLQKKVPARKKGNSSFYVLLGVLLISVIAFLGILHYRNRPIQDATLICLNPEGKTPHSAIFKVDRQGTGQTSLLLDFGDSRPNRTIFKDSLVNHFYETPGRYFPVLYYKNMPIDTAIVYLRTEGWSAIGSMQHDTTRVYPILNKNLLNADLPKASLDDVYHAGIDTNRTFFLSYTNIKPTQISADNFELTTYVKTSPTRPGVRCSQVNFTIYGENGLHSFTVMKPECVAWSYCQFSENNRYGASSDLRQLGHDLQNGGRICLRISNKQVNLFINDKLIMKTAYKKAIDKLMGIKIAFAGAGSFNQLSIKDLNTKQSFLP